MTMQYIHYLNVMPAQPTFAVHQGCAMRDVPAVAVYTIVSRAHGLPAPVDREGAAGANRVPWRVDERTTARRQEYRF